MAADFSYQAFVALDAVTGAPMPGVTGVLRSSPTGSVVTTYDMLGNPRPITTNAYGAVTEFRADLGETHADFGSVILPLISIEEQRGGLQATAAQIASQAAAVAAQAAQLAAELAAQAAADASVGLPGLITDNDDGTITVGTGGTGGTGGGTTTDASLLTSGTISDARLPAGSNAAEVGSKVPFSIAVAKGDLFVGTGSGTLARQAVGSSGQSLTANPATSTGVQWATPAGGGGGTDASLLTSGTLAEGRYVARLSDANLIAQFGGSSGGAGAAQVLDIRDYGGVINGSTDDSAAWVAAIAAANAQGRAIFMPAGTSRITRSTFLPDLTGLGASIVGDPSGESVMSFTAAGGGISIGNGSAYVYATKLMNLKIQGNGVCNTPVRMRLSEEACFIRLWVIGAAVAAIDVPNYINLFTSQRLTFTSCPVGMRLAGENGYLSFFQSNFYQVTQVFQVVSGTTWRMVFNDGWTEACPDFLTVQSGAAQVAFSQVIIKDSYFMSTLAATRVFRVISSPASTWVNSLVIKGCQFNFISSTTPVIDTTAVALNSSGVNLSFCDNLVNVPAFSSQVLIKPHASQSYGMYTVDVQRVQGLPANQWTPTPATTGSVESFGSDLGGGGSPEGSVAAFVGSTYRRVDGGAGTSFYVKQSGTGSTGWVAK